METITITQVMENPAHCSYTSVTEFRPSKKGYDVYRSIRGGKFAKVTSLSVEGAHAHIEHMRKFESNRG